MQRLYAHIVLHLCILVLSLRHSDGTIVHNVVYFGARPNGVADTTKAFLESWKAACSTDGPSVIEVPMGRYLLKPITFKGSKCKGPITIQINGSLIAPSDYKVLGKVENWITFKAASGISIIGGVLDAKGETLWTCKNSGRKCPGGATTLRFVNSSNILISGVTSLNSQMFHIGINGCQNVHLEGVEVIASDSSPNTDGIHVESSMHVTITNSTMRTGDDCISVGPGSKNLHIENVLCGPGHGISIGSLGWDNEEQGVQNVTVRSVVMSNTTNGLRIKSWARPSSGFVQGVLYENVTLRHVKYPIIVDQNYCPDKKDCPNKASGVKITNVTYRGVTGISETKIAVLFDCSPMHPCTGIQLQNINITSLKKAGSQAKCNNIQGETIDMVQPQSCF